MIQVSKNTLIYLLLTSLCPRIGFDSVLPTIMRVRAFAATRSPVRVFSVEGQDGATKVACCTVAGGASSTRRVQELDFVLFFCGSLLLARGLSPLETIFFSSPSSHPSSSYFFFFSFSFFLFFSAVFFFACFCEFFHHLFMS